MPGILWAVLDRMVFIGDIALVAAVLILFAFLTSPATNRRTWFAVALAALAPLGLGFLMLAVTPTYFRPLVTSTVGIWILVVFCLIESGMFAVLQLGSRQFARGRGPLGVALIAVSSLVAWVSTLYVILLGPAFSILAEGPPSYMRVKFESH